MDANEKIARKFADAERTKEREDAIKQKRKELGAELLAMVTTGLLTNEQEKEARRLARGTQPRKRRKNPPAAPSES
jgi:hypothetical protein